MIKIINQIYKKNESNFNADAFKLVFSSLLFGVIDGFGIFLILPIVEILIYGSLQIELMYISDMSNLSIVGLMIFMLILRLWLTLFLVNSQNKVIYSFIGDCNKKVFEIVSTDFSEKDLNKEDLIQVGNIEINNVGVGVYLQLVRAASEVSMVLMMFLFLMFKLPYTVGTSLALIGILLLINLSITQKALKIWGKNRIGYDSKRISFYNLIFDGNDEVHTYKNKKKIFDNFSDVVSESMKLGRYQQVLKYLQKYLVEIIFLIAIAATSLFSTFIPEINNELNVSGVVFVLGIVKIIPSLNRIATYFNSINYFESSLAKVMNFYETASNKK